MDTGTAKADSVGHSEKAHMTKQEVIERLCAMASKVGSEVFKDEYLHDCFCTEVHKDSNNFRFDDNVMDFIKTTVNKAINEARC